MSPILDEPAAEPMRSYFSQQCVLLTGIATGLVEAPSGDTHRSPTYQMGRRDGYHVVVAHLSASRTLREASEKCIAFGRGVQERADTHPYGPEWAQGFAQATLEAAMDITMYAATAAVPPIDKARLRAARTAARHLSPLNGIFAQKPVDAPRSHREW